MFIVPRNLQGKLALSVVLFGFVACSGSGGGPTTPATTPITTPPTTVPAVAVGSPVPTPSNDAAASCRYGKGTVDTRCQRQAPRFVGEVDAAIALLVQQEPQIFNLQDQAGPGGYLVLDQEKYIAGVMRNLRAKDFCAGFDLKELQVKNGNEFSEQYDILVSNGHARRGDGSYRTTCNPASFPLDPEDLIDSVRVAFFGFRCADGVTPPRNGEGKLPVGCFGFVTATPKNKNNEDVDSRIHGQKIDWVLKQEGEIVRMDDASESTFNKNLYGLNKGHFTLCAVVREVEGCLHGEVIP
jgi:hypothetical protein